MGKNKLVLVAVMLGLALAPAAAFAALSAVGPVVPYNAATHTGNGFPQYYTDANGVSVTIPVPAFGDGVGVVPPTQIFAPVLNPAPPSYTPAMHQFSVDIGFDTECFYYNITPDRATFDQVIDPLGKGGSVNVLIGLEAGFGTPNPVGAPQDGQQSVFQRIRINWFNAPVGKYRFTHPYGVEDNIFADGTNRSLVYTVDVPLGVIGSFNLALAGKINVFCRQSNPLIITPGTPAPYNNPANWLGDGFSVSPFTGAVAPNLNQFKFEAFNIDGTPNNIFLVPGTTTPTNTVTTNLATISGFIFHKKAKIPGVLDLLLLS